jgi:hypothetical protein
VNDENYCRRKIAMKWLVMGIIFGLASSCRKDGTWFLRAKTPIAAGAAHQISESASPEANHESPGQFALPECLQSGPPVVLYDRNSNQLKYCDAGKWSVISTEEFRARGQEQAAEDSRRNHEPSTTLPASPLHRKKTLLPRGGETASADDHAESGNNPSAGEESDNDQETELISNDSQSREGSFYCRAFPTGGQRSFHCQKSKARR